MKKAFVVAVAVIIDIPEEHSAGGVPLGNDPLDELAARLRREAAHGRDHSRTDFEMPNVTAQMAAAYRECVNQN